MNRPKWVTTLRALEALESQPVAYQRNRRQAGLGAGTALVLVIASAFFALACVQLALWVTAPSPRASRADVFEALSGPRR